jgi:hypothetical protein
MKLAEVTSNEPTERIAVSVKASTHANLKAYRDSYKATYGKDVTMSEMIEKMLMQFMGEDKNFQKYLSQSSKKEKTSGKPD